MPKSRLILQTLSLQQTVLINQAKYCVVACRLPAFVLRWDSHELAIRAFRKRHDRKLFSLGIFTVVFVLFFSVMISYFESELLIILSSASYVLLCLILPAWWFWVSLIQSVEN